MINSPFTLHLSDPDSTVLAAQTLAPQLVAGDTILLTGDVGAGKTHFARALIQQMLDVVEDVPSPTFTLVQTYDTPTAEIWHSDLYRLTSTQEIEELGLIDAFDTAICLIEWPDRLGDVTPDAALSLFLTTTPEDTRTLRAEWSDPKWAPKLTGWAA